MKYGVIDIHKSFDYLKVLDGITIDFEQNKTTCILGPSGCGKTTLLDIIGGTIEKDSGDIVGFENEDISFIFQEDRLIQWKNVKDNIGFVLKNKMDKKQIEFIIDKYLKLVNLDEYKYFFPNKLSGGMRQRISILRAFAYSSKLLVMDEPFKSLDINNKQIVMSFFKKLKIIEKRTCIFVTHDLDEALCMGDNIVVLTDKPTKVKKFIKNTFLISQNERDRVLVRNSIEKGLML